MENQNLKSKDWSDIRVIYQDDSYSIMWGTNKYGYSLLTQGHDKSHEMSIVPDFIADAILNRLEVLLISRGENFQFIKKDNLELVITQLKEQYPILDNQEEIDAPNIL